MQREHKWSGSKDRSKRAIFPDLNVNVGSHEGMESTTHICMRDILSIEHQQALLTRSQAFWPLAQFRHGMGVSTLPTHRSAWNLSDYHPFGSPSRERRAASFVRALKIISCSAPAPNHHSFFGSASFCIPGSLSHLFLGICGSMPITLTKVATYNSCRVDT